MNLMDLLPPSIYEGNVTMQELQGILTADINGLAAGFNTMLDQAFVNTATTLLSRYEEVYGLEVDVSKSNEFRRERIRAKIRGTGTTTKQMIQDVAAAFSGGDVEVIEHNDENRFVVKFVGRLGIPENMADLTLTIEEIKPAHLAFTFEYTYRRYEELKPYTYGQLRAYTHQIIREGVI